MPFDGQVTETRRLKCSEHLPAEKGEVWTVQGVGGEPNERWTVLERAQASILVKIEAIAKLETNNG